MYTQHHNTQGPFAKHDQCGSFEKGSFGRKFKEHFMGNNHPLKELQKTKTALQSSYMLRDYRKTFLKWPLRTRFLPCPIRMLLKIRMLN